MEDRLLPTGQCWCGCGEEAGIGSFFRKGHDKKAERGLRELLGWQDIARFLFANGYGDVPGNRNLYEDWRRMPDNANRRW